MADNINDIILRTPHGGTAMLPAGEFEGPVYITKPIRLVGKDTTIWAKRGSVIEVTAQGAAIEDLRVELTEGDVRPRYREQLYNDGKRARADGDSMRHFWCDDFSKAAGNRQK